MEEAVYSLKGIQDNQNKSEKGKNKWAAIFKKSIITGCTNYLWGRAICFSKIANHGHL